MLQLIKRFVREESGLETVEYAVMAGLIVVGVILTVTTLGGKVKAKLDALEAAL
jgi:Flp pilus assembly pilin Flp